MQEHFKLTNKQEKALNIKRVYAKLEHDISNKDQDDSLDPSCKTSF